MLPLDCTHTTGLSLMDEITAVQNIYKIYSTKVNKLIIFHLILQYYISA